MKSKIKIAPSILAADFRNLQDEIKKVEKAGADWIHCDVMDGHFVDNLTFGPVVVEAINRATKLPLDVHLMIENPVKYIKDFAQAGADILTVHIEACPNLKSVISKIKSLGMKAGCSVRPQTSLSKVKPYLKDLDLLLIMSVNPGFAGQGFISSVLPKVKEAKKLKQEKKYKYYIEIDGGINPKTAKLAKKAGAEVLVAASAIFKAKDHRKAIRELREA
ncbi:MAG TPA: ribulose-phosphate 3-epimerase [candidate division Zixibacteria bacterium]|nr:ribulose-phosphate 3-epimerase [candidate division Zixibacteria bacterium]